MIKLRTRQVTCQRKRVCSYYCPRLMNMHEKYWRNEAFACYFLVTFACYLLLSLYIN
jgi:hypothetical protein